MRRVADQSAALTAWACSCVEVREEGIQFIRAKEGISPELPFQSGSCLKKNNVTAILLTQRHQLIQIALKKWQSWDILTVVYWDKSQRSASFLIMTCYRQTRMLAQQAQIQTTLDHSMRREPLQGYQERRPRGVSTNPQAFRRAKWRPLWAS